MKEDIKKTVARRNNFDSFNRAIRYLFNRELLESEMIFIHKIIDECMDEYAERTYDSKRQEILSMINEERVRQIEKWGFQEHNYAEWMAILAEEVGESAKEAVDYHFKNPVKDWTGNYVPPSHKEQSDRLSRLKKELIQTAAVCVQILEQID